MKLALCVALGGCLGALTRWGLSGWIDSRPALSATHFPVGIFVANILGCLLFGILFGIGEGKTWMTAGMKAILFTGFLGSFTTFSTFSWNTLYLVKAGQIGVALLNVALSVLVGLIAVWIGYVVGGRVGAVKL